MLTRGAFLRYKKVLISNASIGLIKQINGGEKMNNVKDKSVRELVYLMLALCITIVIIAGFFIIALLVTYHGGITPENIPTTIESIKTLFIALVTGFFGFIGGYGLHRQS